MVAQGEWIARNLIDGSVKCPDEFKLSIATFTSSPLKRDIYFVNRGPISEQ